MMQINVIRGILLAVGLDSFFFSARRRFIRVCANFLASRSVSGKISGAREFPASIQAGSPFARTN